MATQEEIQATRESIAKWEAHRDTINPETVELGMTTCPLCILCEVKYDDYTSVNCDECPIKRKTSYPGCSYTPYLDAVITLRTWIRNPGSRCVRQAWRNAAQAEIDFLQSILLELEADTL